MSKRTWITVDELQHLGQTVALMIEDRLDAGHDPGSVLCSASEIFETWVNVYVNVCWPDSHQDRRREEQRLLLEDNPHSEELLDITEDFDDEERNDS